MMWSRHSRRIGADDAFDVGILPGRVRCVTDGRKTEGLDRATERRVEGRIAVADEEPHVRAVRKGLAELLSGPCGRWVRRHIDMQDAPPVVGQDNVVSLRSGRKRCPRL